MAVRPLRASPFQRGWPIYRTALLVGGATALFVLVLWWGNLFVSLRLALQDAHFLPSPVSDHITLVAIDNASLAAYGRTPAEWPRTVFADFINRMTAAEPRVLAFDILFTEPTREDAALLDAIAASQNEIRTRIIMPLVGIEHAPGPRGGQGILSFEQRLGPSREIANAADYLGVVSTYPDADGKVRRQPSIVIFGDNRRLAFSLTTYLAYLRIPAQAFDQVISQSGDTVTLAGQTQLQVDPMGFWRQEFFNLTSSGSSSFPVYSMVDVVNGEIEPNAFHDRIVLVGLMNSTGITDEYGVPISPLVSGIEIQAHAIETLLQNAAIRTQSRGSEVFTIILFSMAAGFLYARLRWYVMVAVALLLIAAWFTVAFAYFGMYHEMLNLFHPALALLLPALAYLGVQISVELNRRQKAEFLLESVVEVSGLRLAIDHVAIAVARDIRRIARADSVSVWVVNPESQLLERVCSLPVELPESRSAFADIAEAAHARKERVFRQRQFAIPVLWQGRLVAVFAGQLHPNQRLRPATLAMLDRLASEIAPSLENAMLHREVQHQRRLLDTVIEGSPSGIIVLDAQLQLRHANAAADNALGIATTGDRQKSLHALLEDAAIADTVRSKLAGTFAAGKAFREELKHQQHVYLLDGAPLNDSGEWVVLLNDVSALSELSELKTRMIRVVSHDLKNPLSAIMLSSSLILERLDNGSLTDKQRELLHTIARSTRTMQQLIDDILSLEQMRSGIQRKDPINLAEVIAAAEQRHQEEITRKDHRYSSSLEPDLPPLLGNYHMLVEAMTNLISNAVKYTPDGGEISVRVYRQDGRARVEVRDTGYGIPAEAQANLFQEFYRVNMKETAHIKGTGLGLSLVRAVIESHDGRIWVESAEGAGSTFFIELPLSDEAAPEWNDE